ncbi:SRPBCC family protein [Kovacikia minuta CCNUW1]|uniref:SRPBCC family protein n=1 Tax=Kovacikia minuta TaxID=2931930 RepID=UPI001CCD0CC7|nr:SRPBCC family protein [Kovacikia minuta]UBF27261.1 SRPBCC family protein [Kovacikia minuta CCNUW1]
MPASQVLEQSIQINASATIVERCITDLTLMHRWLNPALRCEPVGEWSTDLGGQSRFIIQIPLLQPTLKSVVVQREPGLIVWEFKGFFRGRDRWECNPELRGTRLLNRFEFEIPNPIVRFGFNQFAASLTQEDMQAQLRRLKRVAEEAQRKDEG